MRYSSTAKITFYLFLIVAISHRSLCLDQHKNSLDGVTCIILGASGDLAKRDLIPALYQIFKENTSQQFTLIGAALPHSSAQEILDGATSFVSNIEAKSWQEFSALVNYVQLDFGKPQDFAVLKKVIVDAEKSLGLPGNRIIYCSTSWHFFESITQNLVEHGILQKDHHSDLPWQRIVYEKPFGNNLQSARKLESSIQSLLSDHQIFRIDHFLYTQALSNVIALRALNPLFARTWDNTHIERIDILFNETLSVSTRGKLYDALGVMLDVVQNHVFQMLAIAAMEVPENLNSKNIKRAKINLLKEVKFIDGCLGQYDGYLEEKDVAKNSSTETFASLNFMIENPRWKGVPFRLVAGKCLDKTEICIRLTFKTQAEGEQQANVLTVWIAPEPGFELNFAMKRIEIDSTGDSVGMIYTFDRKNSYSTETYKTIFQELLKGNAAISVDFEEIEAAWQLTDHIKAQKLPLIVYPKGSKGQVQK